MNRNGKIARLPREIREQLNRSLADGLPGRELVAWLNQQPAVQDAVQRWFEGYPVTEQNLSEWRRGGYAEWQLRQDLLDRARALAEDAEGLEETGSLMADHAARLLALHYASALTELKLSRQTAPSSQEEEAPEEGASPHPSKRGKAAPFRKQETVSPPASADDPSPDDEPSPALARLKQLSSITRDLVALRRSETHAVRLRIEQFAFSRACHDHDYGPAGRESRPFPSPLLRKWCSRRRSPEEYEPTVAEKIAFADGIERLMREYFEDQGVNAPQTAPEETAENPPLR